MADIKLITKDTKLPELIKFDWDVVINNIPYYVVRIPGYCHTIGGKYGNNDLWAYPRNEEPNYTNLIEFDCNSPVVWGIKCNSKNITKIRWDECEASTVNSITITRNNEDFYTLGGNINYGIDKARVLIEEFKEHPIDCEIIDFDKKVIGRKVWWRSEPAKVTHWCSGQACVILEPDGIDKFKIPKEFENEDLYYECETAIKADILDKNIWWFRD